MKTDQTSAAMMARPVGALPARIACLTGVPPRPSVLDSRNPG